MFLVNYVIERCRKTEKKYKEKTEKETEGYDQRKEQEKGTLVPNRSGRYEGPGTHPFFVICHTSYGEKK